MGFSRQEYWSGVPLPSLDICLWIRIIWVVWIHQLKGLKGRAQTSLKETYCCREKSILTPRWNCFLDLFSVALVSVITHKGLPQRVPPLCLTYTEVLLFRTLSTCRRRKEETNTAPCLRLAVLGDIRQINGLFFTLFPHFWSIKELGIQIPTMLFWDVLACHLPGQLAIWMKSIPCFSTSSIGFIGLSCNKQSELGLCNTACVQKLQLVPERSILSCGSENCLGSPYSSVNQLFKINL